MPVHDWTRVEAGIFHAFHQQWIIALSNSLNTGVLPGDFYALPEQYASGFGPDVLTLEKAYEPPPEGYDATSGSEGNVALVASKPTRAPNAETELGFYRRKQTSLVVRHVTGDRVVAMVEIVSPGNKSSTTPIRNFVEKAAEMLERGVHLLIIDLFPPTRRDPNGIHAAIWDEVAGQPYQPPGDKPLTVAAYEADLSLRAYVEPVAVGDVLPNMPLFLEPNACVEPPLEASYQTAFDAMPRRWRSVLEHIG